MKDLIKSIDNLPLLVKILLCLPITAIFWAVYRIIKSVDANNVLGIVVAVILIFCDATFFWVVDLICLILNGKVWWFC